MKTNFLFTSLVLLILGIVGPMVISDFVGSQRVLNMAHAQNYIQSHCEELSNANDTTHWYECAKEVQ